MKLHGDIGQSVADYLGIARTTFSSKINETNGAEFTQSEISKLKARYEFSADEVDGIFFNQQVSKKDTQELEKEV